MNAQDSRVRVVHGEEHIYFRVLEADIIEHKGEGKLELDVGLAELASKASPQLSIVPPNSVFDRHVDDQRPT